MPLIQLKFYTYSHFYILVIAFSNSTLSTLSPPRNEPQPRDFVVYSVAGSQFDVDSRYSIIDAVGRGAYGIVCAAVDTRTDEQVAIKKISNVFQHTAIAKQSLREIRLMRLLQHENIVKFYTIMKPQHSSSFRDLYVVTELMETDLSSVIKSTQDLSPEHSQFFLYQVLRGTNYMHACNVIHRDLKPRNILVNSNCDLKICDLGLARIDTPRTQTHGTAVMTDYIASRWYRAPEIILGWGYYTNAVDGKYLHTLHTHLYIAVEYTYFD